MKDCRDGFVSLLVEFSMEPKPPASRAFSYEARTPSDKPISGSINAPDDSAALAALAELGLRDVRIAAARSGDSALGHADFFAFNQQLANLAGAGLPVEIGLRLLAREMARGRLRRTVEQVAAEMESGKSMPQAIEAHRSQFPPLYSRIVDAGIRSGNLQAVLLNLGHHLSLVRRIRTLLWQTFTYPVMVLLMFMVVLGYVIMAVFPRLDAVFYAPDPAHHYVLTVQQPPLVTQIFMSLAATMNAWGMARIAIVFVAIVAAVWLLIWALTLDIRRREALLLSLPVLKSVFRRNLIARWCDAVGIGAAAGMDLPGAIALADDAIASPRLRADGTALTAALSEGRPISDVTHGRIIPPLVIAGMESSANANNLPEVMRSLSQSYQQQAESALVTLQTLMSPAVLVIVGVLVFLLMAATLVPMLNFIF